MEMTDATANTAAPAITFWENAANTRWGQYITGIEREALVAAHSSFREPGVGLEIGCEGGRWSRLLADLGWDMIATDVDPAALRLCQERNQSVRCILVQQEDQRFPVNAVSIDLLLCLEVAPVVNQPWFFDEAARVLKPGGKLVGSLNNLLSWRGAVHKAKSTNRRGYQYYEVTYQAFQKSLINHGFSIEEAKGCCWPPFGRHSNSRWVLTAASLERGLRLHRFPSISPWVVYTATRG